MSDTQPIQDDAPVDPTKERTVHLQVRESTRTALNDMRIAIRNHGLRNMPDELTELLQEDWTADVLIRTGIAAFSLLLEQAEQQSKPAPASKNPKSRGR